MSATEAAFRSKFRLADCRRFSIQCCARSKTSLHFAMPHANSVGDKADRRSSFIPIRPVCNTPNYDLQDQDPNSQIGCRAGWRWTDMMRDLRDGRIHMFG